MRCLNLSFSSSHGPLRFVTSHSRLCEKRSARGLSRGQVPNHCTSVPNPVFNAFPCTQLSLTLISPLFSQKRMTVSTTDIALCIVLLDDQFCSKLTCLAGAWKQWSQEKTGVREGDTRRKRELPNSSRVSLARTRSLFRPLLPSAACYAGQL